MLEAAVRDAAFETAIEGGLETNECANDAGRPAEDAEMGRAEGVEAGKGVKMGVKHRGAADNGTDGDSWRRWGQCN